MAQEKILILGAKGMLGTVLTKHLSANSNFQIVTHSQTSAADFQNDLSNYDSVSELLQKSKPSVCINLLALTDVNLCETDKEKAQKLNIDPIKNIAKAVLNHRLSLKFIQISTDHVYDQNNASESDIKIVNHYALSKYIGDEFSGLIDSVVLRTNFFGQSQSTKQSFSDWIIASLKENKPLNGFSDVYFSPLHLSTLVTEIERVVLNFKPGVYNLGSKAGLSKFQFMIELAKHKGFGIDKITATKYADAKIAIPRPLDMRMNVSKYESTFKVQLPDLLEEIKKC